MPGMSRPLDSLGARLRYARKRLDMTQGQLAAAAGMNQSDVSKLERGDMLKTTAMARLCSVLRVAPEWLELGNGEAPSELLAAEDHPQYVGALDISTAQPMSHPTRKLHVTKVPWEELVQYEARGLFEVVLPDDAVLEVARAGTPAVFDADMAEQALPGDIILLRDMQGRHFVRELRVTLDDKRIAGSQSRALPDLEEEKHPFTVVGVLAYVGVRRR